MSELIKNINQRKYVPPSDPTRYWGCTRKKAFETYKKAMKTVYNKHSNDPDIHVYECPHCYSFHIGHKRKLKD